MPTCFHCLAETPDEHYRRVVCNETALYGPWRGWRWAGRDLVSPDGGRIAIERLRGIVFAESIRPKKRIPVPVAHLQSR
jgi:hypothetical protein